jgi:hypothetical protein
MPRFNFDLVGVRSVRDYQGMIFADYAVAARVATELAAELSAIRPELNDHACVVMTDERRNDLTYCVSIAAIGAKPLSFPHGAGLN